MSTQSRGRFVFQDLRALRWASYLAIVLYAINFGLGVTIGNVLPAASGFLTGLTIPFVQAIAVRLVRRVGVVTVIMVIYGFAAIPTGLVGPQALGLWKVLVTGSGAIAFDLLAWNGSSRLRIYLGYLAYTLVAIATLYWGLVLLDLPALNKLRPLLAGLITVYLVEGFLSTFFALRLYKERIQDSPVGRSFRIDEPAIS